VTVKKLCCWVCWWVERWLGCLSGGCVSGVTEMGCGGVWEGFKRRGKNLCGEHGW
jgi:hypothetical protein